MKQSNLKKGDVSVLDSFNYNGKPTPNIFINYLPQEYTKKELVQMFNQFGEIQSAKVMIDLKTGVSKCYGFVRFDSIHSATQAILAMNGMKIPKYNKILLVKFAGSKMENTGEITNSIYVKSLCLHFSMKDIWSIFSKFGKINGIDLITGQKTNLFNGTAVITYSSVYEAQEAIRIMNNIKLTPESWPLFIQYSKKPAENLILDSDAVSFVNGIKIVKPKNKLVYESEKSCHLLNNNQFLSSSKSSIHSIKKNNQKLQNSIISDMVNKPTIYGCNNFDIDEIWNYHKNEETISSENEENFMFSIIAEEL